LIDDEHHRRGDDASRHAHVRADITVGIGVGIHISVRIDVDVTISSGDLDAATVLVAALVDTAVLGGDAVGRAQPAGAAVEPGRTGASIAALVAAAHWRGLLFAWSEWCTVTPVAVAQREKPHPPQYKDEVSTCHG
jgi:hypothetical protein